MNSAGVPPAASTPRLVRHEKDELDTSSSMGGGRPSRPPPPPPLPGGVPPRMTAAQRRAAASWELRRRQRPRLAARRSHDGSAWRTGATAVGAPPPTPTHSTPPACSPLCSSYALPRAIRYGPRRRHPGDGRVYVPTRARAVGWAAGGGLSIGAPAPPCANPPPRAPLPRPRANVAQPARTHPAPARACSHAPDSNVVVERGWRGGADGGEASGVAAGATAARA